MSCPLSTSALFPVTFPCSAGNLSSHPAFSSTIAFSTTANPRSSIAPPGPGFVLDDDLPPHRYLERSVDSGPSTTWALILNAQGSLDECHICCAPFWSVSSDLIVPSPTNTCCWLCRRRPTPCPPSGSTADPHLFPHVESSIASIVFFGFWKMW